MRKKILLSGALLLFCFFQTMAQQRTITGTVSGTDGKPLANATVLIVGQKLGVSTDATGNFSINVPSGAKQLEISYVGSETQRVDISSTSNVTVSLQTSAKALSDVVIVGYGTVKKKDLTGSVATITTKDFNKGVIATPEQLLQGRTPGVSITPASGEPGGAATITIRGSASIRGNQEPLYVVDGVPLTSGGTMSSQSGAEGSTTPRNPLSFLNPNDIESITVLKDASSEAIYGSRGANGVVIITTKTGSSGRGSLTFNTSVSVAKIASRYDLLSAQDFLLAVKKANIDAGTSPADAAVAVTSVDKGYSTDWQDQIFRTGVSQNYNLGWGISRKATDIRLSGSYDDIQGTVKTSGLKRLTGRANITQKFIDDRLRFDVALTYSNVKNSYAPVTNSAGYQGSLIGAAITFNPTYPVYNPDGSFYDPLDGNRNPAEMLAYFTDNDNNNRFLTSVSGSFLITKGLTFKSTFGYDDATSERLSYADPRLSSNGFGGTTNVFGKDLSNPIAVNGRAVKQNLDLKSILAEQTLTYDKAFSNSSLNVVAGFSYQNAETQYNGKVGWGLNTPVTGPKDTYQKNFGQYKNYYDYVPDYTKEELQSYFGRVNYTIASKYYLTATVRTDGSSKFGSDNKYGTFPAFAAKWRLDKENFMASSIGKIFSDFSIRANYGTVGSSDGIGAYDPLNIRQAYLGNSGGVDTQFVHQGNNKLKWETATTTGVGIDFATNNNRFSGTVDYFFTKRKNILFFGPTPGGFSATSNYFSNLPGYVQNSGWEFSFNYKAIEGKKFTWTIGYNMTFLKNVVKDFNVIVNTGEVSGQGLTGAYAQTIQDGYPLFTWKMPTFQGFDGNGDARYANGGKDELQGSALPKFFAGLTNNFTLGRWSASLFVNTVTGGYNYNNTANALFLRGSIKTAHNVNYATANSPEDPINPGSVSSRFLEKADFIRISNATIGYSFDIKSKVIHTLSVNATGQNLALFTNYSGLDPEVNVDKNINGYPSRGFDYAGYPKSRVFTLGVNVGF